VKRNHEKYIESHPSNYEKRKYLICLLNVQPTIHHSLRRDVGLTSLQFQVEVFNQIENEIIF